MTEVNILHKISKNLYKFFLPGVLVLIMNVCGTDTLKGGDPGARLLESMTLEEKVDQMSGGLYTTGDWYAFMMQINNDRLGIPSHVYRDGPRGVRKINSDIKGTTTFPVAASRASSWDLDLEERIGKVMGIETRALGANVLLAPTVNQVINPRWGRAQETYGEDVFLLGKMGAAFIKGVQSEPEGDTYRVQSCVKHFAAYNIENNRKMFDARIDERILREVFIRHFKMIIDEADVSSFMGAYNKVNGEFNCVNYHLIREILKGEWGFDGYIISDWFANGSTISSLSAGLDVEMPFSEGDVVLDHPYFYGSSLINAVERGEVSEDLVDEAVLRILKRKIEFGILDYEAGVSEKELEKTEHIDLTLEAARKGTVLLKNNGTLPLDKGGVTKVVTVGEFANISRLGDEGSSNCTPSYSIDPTEGLENLIGASKVETYETVAGNETAVTAADYVFVVAAYRPAPPNIDGWEWAEEGEEKDRISLSLPSRDIDNINAAVTVLGAESKTKLIVVIESGGAVLMPWIDDVAAVIMAWYPGMEGGTALAEIIFGDVNPSGKICQTFPADESQLPYFPNDVESYTVGYYHGYRHVDKEGTTPLFHFGYGLSYTSYGYANIAVDNSTIAEDGMVTVSVDVTNTGTVDGEEVVQLYVGYDKTSVSDSYGRPVKELKGFARVALSAKETRTVDIEVKASDLAYFNTAACAWEVEKMEYQVYVGPSSDPAGLLQTIFSVE